MPRKCTDKKNKKKNTPTKEDQLAINLFYAEKLRKKTLQWRKENGYETKTKLLKRADKITTSLLRGKQGIRNKKKWALVLEQGKDCSHRLGYTTEQNTLAQDKGRSRLKDT